MKNILFIHLIIFLLIGIISCKSDKRHNQDISEHSNDEQFRQKHELPTNVDHTPKGEKISIPVIGDDDPISAYVVQADEPSDHFVFVFHEWWGLNDQIIQESDRLFDSLRNVNIMALDLYDGGVTSERSEAAKLMQTRDGERLKQIIRFAAEFAGPQAKIVTVGWCFGGGWSLRAAHQLADQAVGCVMYYGQVPIDELVDFEPIRTDVLGIFAEEDQHITLEYAQALKSKIEDRGQKMKVHSFEADHAFANPSSPRYVEEAATEANRMVLSYMRSKFEN